MGEKNEKTYDAKPPEVTFADPPTAAGQDVLWEQVLAILSDPGDGGGTMPAPPSRKVILQAPWFQYVFSSYYKISPPRGHHHDRNYKRMIAAGPATTTDGFGFIASDFIDSYNFNARDENGVAAVPSDSSWYQFHHNSLQIINGLYANQSNSSVSLASLTDAFNGLSGFTNDLVTDHGYIPTVSQWRDEIAKPDTEWDGQAAGTYWHILDGLVHSLISLYNQMNSGSTEMLSAGSEKTNLQANAVDKVKRGITDALAQLRSGYQAWVSGRFFYPDEALAHAIDTVTILNEPVAQRHHERGPEVEFTFPATATPDGPTSTYRGDVNPAGSFWTYLEQAGKNIWSAHLSQTLDKAAVQAYQTLKDAYTSATTTLTHIVRPDGIDWQGAHDPNMTTNNKHAQDDAKNGDNAGGSIGDLNGILSDFGNDLNNGLDKFGQGLGDLGDGINDGLGKFGDGVDNFGDGINQGLNNFGNDFGNVTPPGGGLDTSSVGNIAPGAYTPTFSGNDTPAGGGIYDQNGDQIPDATIDSNGNVLTPNGSVVPPMAYGMNGMPIAGAHYDKNGNLVDGTGESIPAAAYKQDGTPIAGSHYDDKGQIVGPDGKPIPPVAYDKDGTPIAGSHYDANGDLVGADGMPVSPVAYDQDGMPIQGSHYDANGDLVGPDGEPVPPVAYDSHGQPVSGSHYGPGGTIEAPPVYDASGHEIPGAHYDAHGQLVDGSGQPIAHPYDKSGHELPNVAYDKNGHRLTQPGTVQPTQFTPSEEGPTSAFFNGGSSGTTPNAGVQGVSPQMVDAEGNPVGSDLGSPYGTGGVSPLESAAAASSGQPAASGIPMYPPGMGMGMGMGGMGGMGGGQNGERERTTWVAEDEEVWGTEPDLAPAVLGRPRRDSDKKGEGRGIPSTGGAGRRVGTSGGNKKPSGRGGGKPRTAEGDRDVHGSHG
ncbi:hypothetical protein OG417_23920 [Actinoallomurus sp. NBC_01490]|uniref:hypothetical protein n=1 Tax=Actinoallomurus sp. NBC_01490 TaxID=2903557 RepID=UPI002E33B6F3|nr:hypothetical protein [Actinoallomurus sp. NBC_01490]